MSTRCAARCQWRHRCSYTASMASARRLSAHTSTSTFRRRRRACADLPRSAFPASVMHDPDVSGALRCAPENKAQAWHLRARPACKGTCTASALLATILEGTAACFLCVVDSDLAQVLSKQTGHTLQTGS